jgi:serine/threonine protein phosphatase 1
MLGRWLGETSSDARPSGVPPGRAVYVVGDIHGRLDLLEEILQRIADDAGRYTGDVERSLIFLGDYIDRGPDSRGVVDRLIQGPPKGFECVHLMGNHEEALLQFVNGASNGLEWLSFGGLETLLSYGVTLQKLPRDAQAQADLREALKAAIPASHLDFFRRCSLHHMVGDYVFVHAGVRPGVALDRQLPTDLLWIRNEFLRVRVPLPGHIVVHGHTIVELPQDLTYRINLDTGAFASGCLTCLVLRATDRRFMSTTQR